MLATDRIDAFQRRHRLLHLPLSVVYKFFEDAGMHLVATLAYYALVSSFPVTLLFAALVYGLMAAFPVVQEPLGNSLLASVPVVSTVLRTGNAPPGGAWGLAAAIVGSLYGGLGVANGMQHAMNTVWGVPRNSRPNPLKSRVVSLGILALMIGSVVASSVVAGLQSSSGGPVLGFATFPAILCLNIGCMILAFRIAQAGRPRWREVAPGAVIAGFAWVEIQVTSMSKLRDYDMSTATPRSVALLVLALVAVLHVAALVLVFCAELNVVLARRLYPRALLTPFTDNVELTAGDVASYSSQARAQRFKGYQQIEVTFAPRESSSRQD